MVGTRIARAALIAVAASAIPTGTAMASTTYTDTLKGTEVGFTSTQGRFAGYASGDLPGAWAATINHTVLSPNATITGGTFTLDTIIGSSTRTVNGTFARGGTVTRTYQAAGCGTQRYAVRDALTHVGVN